MPHPPTDPDPRSWQRYFAMVANNRAWQLAGEARDAARDLEMLNAAHAAAWHWKAAGTELNHMRALMLLAEVHALLGLGSTAFAWAEEMKRYFLGNDETPDWEIAFTHAVYAQAARAAGRIDLYEAAYREAEAAVNAVADDEDRAIVLGTFRRIPAP